MAIENDIGISIKASRIRFRMTQTEFAREIGVSRQVISELERDIVRVSEETLQKILDYIVKQERHEPLESIIDYLRVTFPVNSVSGIFKDVLKIDQAYFAEVDSHLYGYIGGYQLDYIKVLYSKKNDDRGVLIQLSGQGCRQFEAFLEAQNRTWFDFFYDCFDYRCRVTRLDLAINDYKEYLSIPTLLNKVLRQELISRFKKFDFNGSGSISEKKQEGTSIYFGSKKSEFYITFYQKNYEQARKLKIPVSEVPIKNRYEMRFKNDRAMLVIKEFLRTGDLPAIILGIMKDYMFFADRRPNVARKYWNINRKWQYFLGDAEKMRLSIEPNEQLYERSKNWFKRTAAATAKMIQEVDEIKGTQEYQEIIDEVEFSDKQLHIIEVQTTAIEDMICI
ncbi:replication initiation factor domain-containing protein [Enterococcus thailandicus]|uniref:replication initiation factor domain-containing protein n=1 Tax=Enterococcus thailandicus TaxID=417368 RepID=UPI0035E375AB